MSACSTFLSTSNEIIACEDRGVDQFNTIKETKVLSKLTMAVVLAGSMVVATTSVAMAAPVSSNSPISTPVIFNPTLSTTLTVSQQSALVAQFNADLPALKLALAAGDSLSQALVVAGFPAIQAAQVGAPSGTGVSGGVQPAGASCQAWTCGWEFSATTTYELEWLVWAGGITGPGLICLVFGAETAGAACAAAAAIWGLVSAYVYSPPRYNAHRCMYFGVGFGIVAKFDAC